MNDWFENEQFWTQYAPIMFDPPRWAEAPAVAAGILNLAGIPKADYHKTHIMDAGCGLGRIAVELALCGVHVTGIDLIQPFLDAAAELACDEQVTAEWIQADLRSFIRPAAFDGAVSMYTSFGYCKTIDEDVLILKNIARSLKKGGFFIIELLGREIAVRDFTEGEWFERGGFTVLTEFTVEGAWEGLRSRWILYDKTGLQSDHTFIQRLYSAVELRSLMQEAGFHSIEIYGGFDNMPYNEKARTLLLIGRV